MAINITHIENVDGLLGIAEFASSNTSGNFWGILLIAIYIILIINLRRHGAANAFAAGSFAILMMSLMFLNLNLLNVYYVVLFAVSLAGSLFAKYFTTK